MFDFSRFERRQNPILELLSAHIMAVRSYSSCEPRPSSFCEPVDLSLAERIVALLTQSRLLGVSFHTGETLYQWHGRVPLSKLARAPNAEMDPKCQALCWDMLSRSLSPGNRIDGNGMSLDEKACLIQSIKLDPSSWSVWNRLASTLAREEFVEMNGSVYDRKACLLQALQRLEPSRKPDNSFIEQYLLDRLAAELDPGMTVNIRGEHLGRLEILSRAINLNPKHEPPWRRLLANLKPGEAIQVDTSQLSSIGYSPEGRPAEDPRRNFNDLNTELRRSFYLMWLALEMPLGQTVEIDRERLTPLQCLIKAVELDPGNNKAWYNCALMSFKDNVSVTIKGEQYTPLQCLVKVLTSNMKNSRAWFDAAQMLSSEETIEIQGHRYDKKGCIVQALSSNEENSERWTALSMALRAGETIVFKGQELDQKDCARRAIMCQLKKEQPHPGLC